MQNKMRVYGDKKQEIQEQYTAQRSLYRLQYIFFEVFQVQDDPTMMLINLGPATSR